LGRAGFGCLVLVAAQLLWMTYFIISNSINDRLQLQIMIVVGEKWFEMATLIFAFSYLKIFNYLSKFLLKIQKKIFL
jgi:hypothetical protein